MDDTVIGTTTSGLSPGHISIFFVSGTAAGRLTPGFSSQMALVTL